MDSNVSIDFDDNVLASISFSILKTTKKSIVFFFAVVKLEKINEDYV